MNSFLLHEVLKINEKNQLKPNFIQLRHYLEEVDFKDTLECIQFLKDKGINFKHLNLNESSVNLEIAINILKQKFISDEETYIH